MSDFPAALALVDAGLRGAAIALLLLVALRIPRDVLAAARGRSAARLLAAFALALCVQIASSTPLFEHAVPSAWQTLPVGISVGNSVLFWLFVRLLFDDDFKLRAAHALPWLAMFLSGLAFCLTLSTNGTPPGAAHSVARLVIRWLPLLFAVLTVLAAARHWSADLLESRRRLRGFVVIGGTIYTVANVALRLQSGHGMLAAPAALFDIACLLTLIAVIALRVLRLSPDQMFAPSLRPAGPPLPEQVPDRPNSAPASATPDGAAAEPFDPQEQQLLDRLHTLMTRERAYAQENLTVASLASQLHVPEYRLRRAINHSLGHRNFNAYVNEFRLNEARSALLDPAKRDLPVLTIALSAGFQSIGPFNRAFKALTGQTPTEYRQRNSTDS